MGGERATEHLTDCFIRSGVYIEFQTLFLLFIKAGPEPGVYFRLGIVFTPKITGKGRTLSISEFLKGVGPDV